MIKEGWFLKWLKDDKYRKMQRKNLKGNSQKKKKKGNSQNVSSDGLLLMRH